MRPRLDYDRIRRLLARSLLHNAEAHEAGSHNYLDRGHEEIERSVPLEGYPEIETLLIALDFWKAWIEASRTGWPDRAEFGKEEWPRMARRIVSALEADREIDDPVLTSRFGPRRRVR
jgi:hypothetical protein